MSAGNRSAAVRLLALAIVADTTEAHELFRGRSLEAALSAGVVVTEDDADVQRLLGAYRDEDRAEAALELRDEFETGAQRCPPRE